MIANDRHDAASVMGRWTSTRHAARHPPLRGAGSRGRDLSQDLRRRVRGRAGGQPAEARKTACEQWFGTGDSNDPFNPSKEARRSLRARAHRSVDRADEFKGYPPILTQPGGGALQAARRGKSAVAGSGLHAGAGRVTAVGSRQAIRFVARRSSVACRAPCRRTP